MDTTDKKSKNLIMKFIQIFTITIMLSFVVVMGYFAFMIEYGIWTDKDEEINIMVKIISTIVLSFLMLVITAKFLRYAQHSTKKCEDCGSRHSHQRMGGTMYYQFICLDCGKTRWEQHNTADKD